MPLPTPSLSRGTSAPNPLQNSISVNLFDSVKQKDTENSHSMEIIDESVWTTVENKTLQSGNGNSNGNGNGSRRNIIESRRNSLPSRRSSDLFRGSLGN